MKPKLALAAMLLATPALAQEEDALTMDEVPPAVTEAALAANSSDADFTAVAMDDGVYEVARTVAEGMGFEVDVTEDGTVEEVERQIMADALPAEVAAALEAEMAGFTPDYVEESTRPDNTIVYEFEGPHEDRTIDAEIAADGIGPSMNDSAAG